MGNVADTAEAWAEVAAAGTAEVADADPRCSVMSVGELVEHASHDTHEPLVADAPPVAIRRAAPHGIPGEERVSLGRKLQAVDEASIPVNAQRARPLIAPARPGAERQRDRAENQSAQHQPSMLGKEPSNCADTFATAAMRGVRAERTNTH